MQCFLEGESVLWPVVICYNLQKYFLLHFPFVPGGGATARGCAQPPCKLGVSFYAGMMEWRQWVFMLFCCVTSGHIIENYNETYSCDLSLHDPVVVRVPLCFNFSESCEEEWTKLPENTSIALVAFDSKLHCRVPCVHVTDRELSLNECSDVQLVVACVDGDTFWEKRIYFHGVKGRPTLNKGHPHLHIGLYSILLIVVLAVIIVGC
ncbi:uncharacterized protein [Heptranchias perlo]|uniref:uncharacterized protein n=1 Tax=Heptranchias perlo TaxID=212740 RepID=UPI00355A16C5